MQIVFFSREYPPDTQWGGESIACLDMARILSAVGHQVHVICQAVSEPNTLVDDHRVYIHRVGNNAKRYSVFARMQYTWSAIKCFNKINKTKCVDIVEGFYGGTEIYLYSLLKQIRVYRAPVILHVHGSIRYAIIKTNSYQGFWGLLTSYVLLYMGDVTARISNRVIAISKNINDELMHDIGIKTKKLQLILNPRDNEKYVNNNIQGKSNSQLKTNEKYILAVGRLERRKGIDVLCKAFNLISDINNNVRCILIGQDTPTAPNGKSFKRYLVEDVLDEKARQKVIFIPFVTEEEIINLYSSADVVVSPSMFEVSTSGYEKSTFTSWGSFQKSIYFKDPVFKA